MAGYLDELNGKVWIAAHAGVSGGDIACNTVPSFQAALMQGADVIELDAAVSRDGTCYVFHSGKEQQLLHVDRPFSDMSDREVEQLRPFNPDNHVTKDPIPRLDKVLNLLRGKCRINIDKFEDNMPQIASCIRACGLEDQVIVKATLTRGMLPALEEHAKGLPFLCRMVADEGQHDFLISNPKLRYIGAEVVYENEQSAFASPRFIDRVHRDGCVLWTNAMVYSYQNQQAAGHSDDLAMTGDPDGGWGWLIRRGYDIILTDWPVMLRLYAAKHFPERCDQSTLCL